MDIGKIQYIPITIPHYTHSWMQENIVRPSESKKEILRISNELKSKATKRDEEAMEGCRFELKSSVCSCMVEWIKYPKNDLAKSSKVIRQLMFFLLSSSSHQFMDLFAAWCTCACVWVWLCVNGRHTRKFTTNDTHQWCKYILEYYAMIRLRFCRHTITKK